jgi:1-acyl-sn-glycerol-3-phosphate acyltransferase
VIFPEGSRSRDGELTPWKRPGLRTLLTARQWQVYILVADGLWRSRSVSDFMRDISSAEIRVETVGPFESPAGEAEVEEFIGRMEALMKETLAGLRVSAT